MNEFIQSFDGIDEIEAKKLYIKALENGYDFSRGIHSTDRLTQTLLIIATKLGSKSVVKKLLEMGANINQTDDIGRTALFYAVRYDERDIFQMLLEWEGIDIMVFAIDGISILSFAIEYGSYYTVMHLIKKLRHTEEGHKYMNSRTEGVIGHTALIMAILTGYSLYGEKLIEAGVDINIADRNGWTALDYALQRDTFRVTKMLIDRGARHNCSALCRCHQV